MFRKLSSLIERLINSLFSLVKKLNLMLFVGIIVLVTLSAQFQPFKHAVSLSTLEAQAVDSKPASKTIVELVVADGSFKTFVAGLRAADLVETLIGKGPFTVFAPSDQAFAALDTSTLKDLFEPEDRDKLIKILTYHIIPGKVISTDLKSGPVKTLAGIPINVKVSASKLMVNDANVSKTDMQASNGVVHVIDKVMIPNHI